MTRLGIAACSLVFLGAASVQAGVKEDVSRALVEFNRDVCRSLNLKGCRSSARKPTRSPVRPVAKDKPAQPGPGKGISETAASGQTVPIPRRKPKQHDGGVTASTALPADTVIPVPRAKPLVPADGNEPDAAASLEKDAKTAAAAPILPAPKSVTELVLPRDAGCQDRLERLAVSFTPKPTFATSGSCSLTDPVLVTAVALDDGKVVFPDQPVLNCAFAESFAKWIKEKGDPAVRREAKSSLSIVYTGPGYECRGRNGDGSAKLSEHGYGNAVDITQFKLEDGRSFQVADALNPASPAYAALKSMRFTACESFSTVLGPGTNTAHAGHFHFDNGRHGKTGTYRICE